MRESVDSRIVGLAALQNGVVTIGQLREVGVGHSSVGRRVNSGLLRRVSSGIYAVTSIESIDAPVRAALLALPGAVASHTTAARLHAMPVPTGPDVHVLASRGVHHGLVTARVHETRLLPAVDVTVVGGFRVTSAARTLCDLASMLSAARLRHVVETQLIARAPDQHDLMACHRSLARQGRPGVVAMRALLLDLLDDEPFPMSQLELMVMVGLAGRGITFVERQFVPPWHDGVSGVVDFADRVGRTILEADGRRWHAVDQDRRRDAERDRLAAKHGWLVLRVGWHEVAHRTESALDDIVEVFECRRAFDAA